MSSDEASESLSPVLCSECRYAAVNEFNFESMMVVSILHPLESPAMVVCASGLVLDTAMWLGDCDRILETVTVPSVVIAHVHTVYVSQF